jgi:hypothetical protein
VFKHKLNPDGMLERYKARWMVRSFNQRPGIDFQETFTPVFKPATIRTMLTIAASKRWPTRQLDVSNAFLRGNLDEHVMCPQPIGFHDADRPQAVCLLDKSLYGLRQASCVWFTRFATFVVKIGFKATRSDSSLFVLCRGHDVAYLLLYVDDMVITASSSSLLQHVVTELHDEFTVKDMGELRFFLNIDIQRKDDGFYLSQSHYAEHILDRTGMAHCKAASTPIDANGKLLSDGAAIDDATSYRSIAGAL